MKRTLLAATFALLCTRVQAQLNIDTTITLDLLKSPVSPAFNMLGISTSAIERPSDLNSFRLSIQNATNNLTAIPQSYAFEIAPFLWSRRKYTLKDFDSNHHAFLQSFTISAGFTHMGPEGMEDVDSLKRTKTAFGIKFSIIRPKWSAGTRKAYTDLVDAQSLLLEELQKPTELDAQLKVRMQQRIALGKDTTLSTTVKRDSIKAVNTAIADLVAQIGELKDAALPGTTAWQQAKAIASAFPTERKGVFLDFTTGLVADFPDNRFNNSFVNKAGAWLTGGYENGNRGITSMFIVRYLRQPDVSSTLDAGARFLLSTLDDKFTLSGEALYRSVLGHSVLDPSWRLVLNTEYAVAKNRKITFSFGRNFDGALSTGGNLVAAVNFIAGFGGERKIK
jgi:hypothetical protein